MQLTPAGRPAKAAPSDWWALILLMVCYGFYNADKALVPVLIEPLKAEFHLTDTHMGLLSGLAVSLPFTIACIPMGMLGDRINRRNLLAMLVGGWSFVTGLTAFAGSALMLFVSRAGVGFFEAGFTPVSLSSLTDRFSPSVRSTAMGIFNLGAGLGMFIGMAMGGFVEVHWGWRAAFLVAGIPGLILAALLWLSTSEPSRGRFDDAAAPVRGNRPTLRLAFGFLLRDKVLRNIAMGMTWGGSMLAVFGTWTPSLLRRTFEMSSLTAGLTSGLIVGVGGALGAAAGGFIADRLGHRGPSARMLVPIAGTILSLVTGIGALLGNWHPASALVLLGLAVFFGQSYLAPGYAMAATLAGPVRRAVTLAIFVVCFNMISYSLGAGIVGKISDLLTDHFGSDSLRFAYMLSFLMFVPAALHFARARQHLVRQNRAGSGAHD